MASPAPNGSSATPDAPKTKTTAADVGWQFVPQYYTMLHDAPERLHCFYNKKSTFVHGVEGEDITPSYGQTDIHQKVLSLGFSDCKAYIHHIDAQSSFSGGIILQVIGEISNKSGPWRKFTQTFFLAEQPNGYFVLNDIFRYLKEDDDEDAGEDEEVESAVGEEQLPEGQNVVEQKSQEAASSVTAEAVHSVSEPIKIDSDILLTNGQPPVSDLAESAPSVQAQQPVTSNVAEASTNEVPETSVVAPKEPATAPVEASPEVKEEESVTEEKAAPVKEETPAPTPAVATPEPTPTPAQQQPAQQQKTQQPKPAASQRQPSGSNKQTSTPSVTAQQQQPPVSSTPAPAATPAAPPKPAAPRTWASTAAAKPNAWGTALATKEALSASAAAGQSQQRPAAQRNPSSQQPQPAQSAQPQQHQAPQQAAQGKQPQGSARFPLVDAARQVQTPICFVKLNNWQAPDGSQPMTEVELRNILNKYGEITKVEIVRDKACAFVEFAKLESARKAIIASLLTVQGGDGGIKTAQGHRIIVESRKEKSERKAGSVTPAPVQGQTQPQLPVAQPAQGQGPKRQQGQAQNGSNHNQNQNQNNQNRSGGNVRGGRGGKTGQSGQQAANAK